jgi:hypothetical protein
MFYCGFSASSFFRKAKREKLFFFASPTKVTEYYFAAVSPFFLSVWPFFEGLTAEKSEFECGLFSVHLLSFDSLACQHANSSTRLKAPLHGCSDLAEALKSMSCRIVNYPALTSDIIRN